MNTPIGLAAYATPVNAPAALLNKTKRLRKVHFVFADTNSHECNTPINDKTLYTRWAPSVTCKGCRELMVAKGMTSDTPDTEIASHLRWGQIVKCMNAHAMDIKPLIAVFESALADPFNDEQH